METNGHQLQRSDVLTEIDHAFPDAPVILTLGGTAREMLAVAGRKPNHLINLDGMGQTVSLGLGVALGRRDRDSAKVVVVEGDGSFIMGLSVATTIGHLRPANLVVLVLDNGVYLATGGQPTSAPDLDFCALVQSCSWAGTREVATPDDLSGALAWARETTGPLLIRILTNTRQIETDFFLEDPVLIAAAFRAWLSADAS
ncbi:MAG TPA: thiamine pyrophosphate-dependent enzyme [Marmoricola sp.]|nr:thiamine pyrophosphate-dependent enzyme [Marmoricola sp.]